MNFILRVCAFLWLSLAAGWASSATIDKMYTATFGHYTQDYQPGGDFVIFSKADYYLLNDGSTWESGAGWHPDTRSTLKKKVVEGDTVSYYFEQPTGGILFQNTDYDGGDHSAQGVLGAPKKLVLKAKLGSTKGALQGYATIVSNDETWYGQPRFNFYSASVGDQVFFRQDFVLMGTSFSEDLFDRSFTYNLTGQVNFTKMK